MLLSVIVPTNGVSQCVLERCLQSLHAQTRKSFQIVIYNHTNKLGLYDSHFTANTKYVWCEDKLNIFDSWNNALLCADGDYVLLIGDDDMLDVRAIDKIYDFIKINSYPDVICPTCSWYGHPGIGDHREGRLRFDMTYEYKYKTTEEKLAHLFSFSRGSFTSTYTIVERSLFGQKDDICVKNYPDLALYAKALYAAKTCKDFDEPVIVHGVHMGNSEMEHHDCQRGRRVSVDFELSPVSGNTFHNGWLESLLQLKRNGEFGEYDINYDRFYNGYLTQLSMISMYEDVREYVDELYGIEFECEHKKEFMEYLHKATRNKFWELNTNRVSSEWIKVDTPYFHSCNYFIDKRELLKKAAGDNYREVIK